VTPDNDDGAEGMDDLFPELAPAAPKVVRVEPGRAALLRFQPPENRAALAEYFDRSDRARSQGRAANASGRAGERWVDDHHERALERGLVVVVDHVGPPTQPHVVRGQLARDQRGRVLAAVTGLAPPDYLGCTADGRALAVEAKRREGRLGAPLSDDELAGGVDARDALERHQAEYLAAVGRAGGLALVVVTFVRRVRGLPVATRHAVPWRELAGRWRSPRGGRLSVGPEDLEDYQARGDCYLLPFCEAA
jgi:hypothetical protein